MRATPGRGRATFDSSGACCSECCWRWTIVTDDGRHPVGIEEERARLEARHR
jgi:hypothetical protein